MAATVDALIGASVVIVTDEGKEVAGDVFAYDSRSKVVVIASQNPEDKQHAALHMVRETSIKDLQYCGPGRTSILPAGPLPAVNEAELRAREEHTMRLAQRQASNTNAEVAAPVQTLFDRIASTSVPPFPPQPAHLSPSPSPQV